MLIEERLGVPPSDVLFVSSNPWDACGAKSFGLNVAWIERVTPEAMARACVKSELVAPLTMFKAIRMQMDELGVEPDYRIHTLSELPGVVRRLDEFRIGSRVFRGKSPRHFGDRIDDEFGDRRAGGRGL